MALVRASNDKEIKDILFAEEMRQKVKVGLIVPQIWGSNKFSSGDFLMQGNAICKSISGEYFAR